MAAVRATEVDLLRVVALVGIAIINVPLVGVTGDWTFELKESFLDQVVLFATDTFVYGKAFPLFAFLFGWGIAVQQRSAERDGQSFNWRYGRRLFGLAVLGILHAVFVYSSDILFLYALLGLLIWPAINWPADRLMRLAASMLPVIAFGLVVLSLWGAEGKSSEIVAGDALDFWQAALERGAGWLDGGLLATALYNGPATLGAFALGIAAARSSFFVPGYPVYVGLRARLMWIFPAGAVASGVAAGLTWAGADEPALGMIIATSTLFTLGAVALCISYVIATCELSRCFPPPDAALAIGRNSLTAYVLQGVLAGFILSDYGLGLLSSFGATATLALTLVICLILAVLAALWQRISPRGPLEALLRWITYWGETKPVADKAG